MVATPKLGATNSPTVLFFLQLHMIPKVVMRGTVQERKDGGTTRTNKQLSAFASVRTITALSGLSFGLKP